MIVQSILNFGKRWNKIADVIKGRTAVQIKNMYQTKIKKAIDEGKLKFIK